MSLIRICFVAVALIACAQAVPIPDATVFQQRPAELDLTPVNHDLTFYVQEDLCEAQVDNIDPKCTQHCNAKGYPTGLCFEIKCSCV